MLFPTRGNRTTSLKLIAVYTNLCNEMQGVPKTSLLYDWEVVRGSVALESHLHSLCSTHQQGKGSGEGQKVTIHPFKSTLVQATTGDAND